jgi:hypothetical protein
MECRSERCFGSGVATIWQRGPMTWGFGQQVRELFLENDARECLLACLWVAAKLNVPRKEVPGSTKFAGLLGLAPPRLNAVEIVVMEVLDWSPLRGWSKPLANEI